MKFRTLAKVIAFFAKEERTAPEDSFRRDAETAMDTIRTGIFPNLLRSGFNLREKLRYYYFSITGRVYANREPVIEALQQLSFTYSTLPTMLANEVELTPDELVHADELRAEAHIIDSAIRAAHVETIRANKAYGPQDRPPGAEDGSQDPDTHMEFELGQRVR